MKPYSIVWYRLMANLCHTDEKTGSNSAQVPKKTVGITWKDEVRNKDIRIRKKTGSQKL